MPNSLLLEAPQHARRDPAAIAALPPQACGDPGAAVPPAARHRGNLLACAACGMVPSTTSTDARCKCTITQLLAATKRPFDHGPVRCSDCDSSHALIDGRDFVCAGILTKHARGE